MVSRLMALALASLLACAPAAAAESDEAVVKRVEDYLNSITTLRANFVQAAHDGAVSEGTLYISRPGRLRIEYDPPLKVVMVSDGEWLTYVDGELGQISQTPLSGTVAEVLVRAPIRFGGDIVVTDVTREAAVLRVTLVRANRTGEGSLTLVFTEEPFDLRQWLVVDPQGLVTRVTLFNAQHGIALEPRLFDAPPPFPQGER